MEQQELSSEQCQTDAKQRCPSKGGSLEQDCGQARDQESKGGELARREALQTELGRNEGAAPVRCSSAPGPPVGSITRVSASLKS